MFSRNFRKSFGFRLFRLFAGIILLIAPVFASAVIYYQTRLVTDELVKEGKIISTLLASNMKTWIYAENSEKLKDSLKDIVPYRNIDSVTVYNAKSEILCQEHKTEQNTDTRVPDFSAIAFSKEDNSAFYIKELPNVINITCPVTMEAPGYEDEILYFDRPASPKTETTIGYMRIGISKETLRKQIRNIVLRVAIAALLSLFAGLAILLIAARRVTNPISELTANVKRFGSGEAVALIPTSGNDEISGLAEAFNAMSLNLAKRNEEKGLLEARLRKAETMEAIGTLARGIAHDFNNILSTIQGSVYLIEKRFNAHNDLMRYSGEIQQSLTKAQGLINGLLTFSRTKTVIFYPVDLNGLIVKLRPLLGNLLGSGIGMHVDLYPEPLTVMGDALQIEQIVMNFAYNARDAMPDGGKLTIITARVSIGEGSTEGVSLKPGMYARMSVIDTGAGMDEEIRQKIFEPFFTTKERGKGTGLGLAIVYGIIEQHHGAIELDSEPGKGTVFHVWLPLYQQASEEADKTEQDEKQ
ncbi:MAG: ATP-binding protein [Thermodesulfovibrionales bacterium]